MRRLWPVTLFSANNVVLTSRLKVEKGNLDDKNRVKVSSELYQVQVFLCYQTLIFFVKLLRDLFGKCCLLKLLRVIKEKCVELVLICFSSYKLG